MFGAMRMKDDTSKMIIIKTESEGIQHSFNRDIIDVPLNFKLGVVA